MNKILLVLISFLIGSTYPGLTLFSPIIPMPEEGALRLTTALYYGPDNRTIQARGVSPEIHIVSDIKSQKLRRESDLPGFLPASKNSSTEETATISEKSCPAATSGRTVAGVGKSGDRTLGCALAFFATGSKQNFLAAYGRASSM